MPPDLSIIIPAYNEAERIEATLEAVIAYAAPSGLDWDLWVVLDGCTDATREVTAPYAERCTLHILERSENCGKGRTIREGMLAAEGRFRLMMDADSSTTAEHFELMRPFFEQGSDVVCCSRHPKDARGAIYLKKQAFPKPIVGQLGNLFIQAMLLPGIWDSQCGFKAFTAAAAEKIFSQCQIDGWAWDIEALALARQLKLRIDWVPAHWENHPDSNVRPHDYLEVARDVWAIRRRLT